MKAAASDTAKTTYTCPMDPEIVQEGPGTCPICGMALEPMGVPSAEERPNPELIDFLHRSKVGTRSRCRLFVLAMGAARRSSPA